MNFVRFKIHPTPLASLATLPLQGRVKRAGGALLAMTAGRRHCGSMPALFTTAVTLSISRFSALSKALASAENARR